ncbi:Protein N-acetyltransferase, RimJ/RimL family [Rhodovulum sp. ES.010]|uniref:GNAT family N-acetyltransferase n=1 Tax=Rhodovulum sp. ES.010 TaxID=1882821 RepID=UPI0009299044|nr:GNAT family N-acetyltransferase [Rhodovulum sp. ES.010]SIO42775.1 Protein N-acetyltransferase, RimJ/RimL family [Rhodovulum sp. ES.010]
MTDAARIADPTTLEIAFPVLETERLVLRGPRPEDWEAHAAFATSDRARFVGGPWSRREAWRGFAARWGHWAMRGFGMFTVTRRGSDAAIGTIGPHFPEGWAEPEIGWILYGGAEGQGLAREAALACRDHAYRVLGWTTAISYIHPDNARSRALAGRLGCEIDPAVPHPFDEPCLVYRHPGPEAVR